MSAKRNTRTGGVLEAMVLPSLEQGGYGIRAAAKQRRTTS